MNQAAETGAVVVAARAGDETAFASLVERYRRELHVHRYRMLGSFEDAEDLVQETFLRAWRKRRSFQGRSTFRAWLYRIATNACLDAIARRAPRTAHAETAGPGPPSEIPRRRQAAQGLLPLQLGRRRPEETGPRGSVSSGFFSSCSHPA